LLAAFAHLRVNVCKMRKKAFNASSSSSESLTTKDEWGLHATSADVRLNQTLTYSRHAHSNADVPVNSTRSHDVTLRPASSFIALGHHKKLANGRMACLFQNQNERIALTVCASLVVCMFCVCFYTCKRRKDDSQESTQATIKLAFRPRVQLDRLSGYKLFETESDTAAGPPESEMVTGEEHFFAAELAELSKAITDAARLVSPAGPFIKVTTMENAGAAKIHDNHTPKAWRRWRYSQLTWWSSHKAYLDKRVPMDSLAMYQVNSLTLVLGKPTDIRIRFVNDLFPIETGVLPKASNFKDKPFLSSLDLHFDDGTRAAELCKAIEKFLNRMRAQFGEHIVPEVSDLGGTESGMPPDS